LKDQEADGRVILEWLLQIAVVNMGGEWNWLAMLPMISFGINSVENFIFIISVAN
jgi:hypothetical protein